MSLLRSPPLFSGLTPLVEDQVLEEECLPVGGVPPDVALLALDTDIDDLLSAGQ